MILRRTLVRFIMATAFVGLAASSCLAQSSSAVSIKDKVAAISEWVRHGESKAQPMTIDRAAGQLMGLANGKSDLKGFGSKYGNPDQGIYFITFAGRPEVVLARRDEKIDRTIFWLIKHDAFSTTVLLHQHNAAPPVVVSGSDYAKAGPVILGYFYDHLPQNNSNNNSSTSGFGDADK